MGKKKAKEPETPAKDEVGYFALKRTWNSPIDVLEKVDFMNLWET